MHEFEYELNGNTVTIEVTDYTPFVYGGSDEPNQCELIELDVWQNGSIIACEDDVNQKELKDILKRFKELNDIA